MSGIHVFVNIGFLPKARRNDNKRICLLTYELIIKFFELEVSARRVTKQVGLNSPIILKAVTIIGLAISVSQEPNIFLSGVIEVDESCFEWRRKGGKDIFI
ncbi:MAG: hypothetical protein WA240_14590 [Nitrospirota bacterium]